MENKQATRAKGHRDWSLVTYEAEKQICQVGTTAEVAVVNGLEAEAEARRR